MGKVTIRELRNHGGDVIDRVAAGEPVTVTRAGVPVAELVPVAGPRLSAATLVERWRRLPPVDSAALRSDIDAVIDPTL